MRTPACSFPSLLIVRTFRKKGLYGSSFWTVKICANNCDHDTVGNVIVAHCFASTTKKRLGQAMQLPLFHSVVCFLMYLPRGIDRARNVTYSKQIWMANDCIFVEHGPRVEHGPGGQIVISISRRLALDCSRNVRSLGGGLRLTTKSEQYGKEIPSEL